MAVAGFKDGLPSLGIGVADSVDPPLRMHFPRDDVCLNAQIERIAFTQEPAQERIDEPFGRGFPERGACLDRLVHRDMPGVRGRLDRVQRAEEQGADLRIRRPPMRKLIH